MNLIELLKQVITSWQMIAITLLILLYISLVLHVSKQYHKPRAKKVKQSAKKQPKAEAKPEFTEDSVPENDSNDELGLEEA